MEQYKTPIINRFLLDLFGIDKLHIAHFILTSVANNKGISKPIILNGINNADELEKFSLLIENVADERLKKGCWYHPKYIPLEDISSSKKTIRDKNNACMLHISQIKNSYVNHDRFKECLIVDTRTPKKPADWEGIFKEMILFSSNLKDLK